ncbi:c-type cytochrome biogenesis protein CcmI [Ferrimonas marina]|uniref:Cytochrome c-type biogenesis protein CcmH n=1 Tax=Ferrimonas marina TaxID=299255 RepID=A0A1M5ZRD2_9GAMM|nr:c-type cytochrome biogenesis protein CcmI [Ferrimonas marina]SHI26790.1 cytochrome c-type biogenesis protein CcmH [Ferrimonas marina]
MTIFWIGIALLTALALAMIWLPFWRRNRVARAASDAQLRKETNLNLFNERIQELDTELAEQRINEEEYEALKQELQVNLLQNVEQEEDVLAARTPSLAWPVVMSAILVVVSGYTYWDLGRHADWNAPHAAAQQADPHSGMNPEQLQRMRLMQMEQHVEANPTDSQAWFSLGHAYISASEYQKAVTAFDQVMALVGEHAELLGPKATAMYYLADQNITPQIQAIVDKALADDEKDPSTRLLLGMDAFFNANFEDAIGHWEMILTSPRTDVDRQAIQNAISQARGMLESGSAMPQDSVHQQVQPGPSSDAGVVVRVELAGQLAQHAQPNDTVFIYARPVAGPSMPLAVARVQVGDLPATIVLDDSKAMSPEMVISSQQQVMLIATVNQDNSPAPTAGDLVGQIDSVNLGSNVTLEIDTLVK